MQRLSNSEFPRSQSKIWSSLNDDVIIDDEHEKSISIKASEINLSLLHKYNPIGLNNDNIIIGSPMYKYKLEWPNSLDFLHDYISENQTLVSGALATLGDPTNVLATEIINDSLLISKMKEISSQLFNSTELPWSKTSEDAITPFKSRASDVGLDLSAVKLIKQTGNLYFLDTDIKFKIPPGYYLQIHPRSSLAKSGYILSNSTGIIDCGYTGSIKLLLLKVDPKAEDIVFPFRCVQAVLAPFVYTKPVETDDAKETTLRNDGGHGSSGV